MVLMDPLVLRMTWNTVNVMCFIGGWSSVAEGLDFSGGGAEGIADGCGGGFFQSEGDTQGGGGWCGCEGG
jgi:hypothetical protein